MKKNILLSLLVVSNLALAEPKLPDIMPSYKGLCANGYQLNVLVSNFRTNNGTEFRCWSNQLKGLNNNGCENTPMIDGTVYYQYEDILGNKKGYWKVPIKKEICVIERVKK